MSGTVSIVGLGPGRETLVTPEVREALAQATDVIGYIPYVKRIDPRPGLTLQATDNRVEIDRAAHALINLVKDQRWCGAHFRQRDLECEHKARHLPARGNLRQGPKRCAGVG